MSEAKQYLALGGITNAAFGDRRALRVRVGQETKWEWREVTDDEYRVMLNALNFALADT